jgi:predicted RNA-binding protein with EMAP domain
MAKADSKSEYVDSWNSHIDTLTRIGFNLEDSEDYDRLQELQKELKEITEKAADSQDWSSE